MRALVLALAFALGAPTIALAQDSEALVEEGIALREDGRDAEALDRFERAYATSRSPRALAQIALAEQALGRFVDAERHLEEALARADAFIRRNQPLLEQALGEIRSQIGELSVAGPSGATVTVGGVERGVLPLEAPLRSDPGTHRVEVRAPGRRPFSADVEIGAGERTDLAVTLEPLPVAATPAPSAHPPSAPRAGAPAWAIPTGAVLAGAGAIGLGLGAGLAAVREDHAQARLACSDDEPACRDRYQAALDAEAGAIASFVIGGALAAGGTALLVWAAAGSSAERDAPALACAPGLLGIACTGTF